MRREAFALVVLALAAPAAAAAGTPVSFYGHVFYAGLENPMPANTQFPWGEADWATGVTDTPCAAPVDDCDAKASNKLVLFSTAGPVKVKSQREFSYASLHNERGLTQDVLLDASQPVTATLHMTPGAYHAWFHQPQRTPCLPQDPPENVPCPYPYWRWHPGASPEFVVKAWLVAAELGPRGDAAGERPPMGEAWAAGDYVLIAKGETSPVTTVHLDGYGGYGRVWRFDLDLGAPLVDRVPATHNLGLVLSWENQVAGQRFGVMSWRINTGEFFPTVFTIPVENPFTVELVHPEEVHDKLAILAVINTPWGSYDVDPDTVALAVRDADGREVEPQRLRVVSDFSVAHGGHYRPVNVTFLWDHRADALAPGTYTATVSAMNYQRSAASEATATFEVLEGGAIGRVVPGRAEVRTYDEARVGDLVARDAPSEGDPGGLALPLALAAGLVVARRRGRA